MPMRIPTELLSSCVTLCRVDLHGEVGEARRELSLCCVTPSCHTPNPAPGSNAGRGVRSHLYLSRHGNLSLSLK